jgi:UDP-glucose:(heptosyl)LPS alpha-1,3-glucosyltransferase
LNKPLNLHFNKSILNTQLPVRFVHVVRRFGPVGGMERYVWELSTQLQQLGHQVTVICERSYVVKPQGITVVELGEVSPRPRWVAALRFDNRFSKWLASNPQPNSIIFSHERISSHDITTFHGSLFATVLEKPWWKLISLRIAMQLFLERRELANSTYIIPNSNHIKKQLELYYPEFASKLTDPITPGVTSSTVRKFKSVPAKGGVIGFVGKEWKRKGLQFAVEVVQQLQKLRPNLQFVVVGPAASEVRHLFSSWSGGFVLTEWYGQVDYSQFDVLIHPAKIEPYGMIISEAMAAKVPVVISDFCGASDDVSTEAGSILSLSSSVEDWVKALNRQLSRKNQVPQFVRSWNDVAQEYVLVCGELVNQARLSANSQSEQVELAPNIDNSSAPAGLTRHL